MRYEKLLFTRVIIFIAIVNICGSETKTLKCSAESDTIDIVYADYGRYDLTTCWNSTDNTNCGNSAGAWKFFMDKCQSRKKCTITHDDSIFALLGNPDPCPSINKYLRVTYQCTGIDSVFIYIAWYLRQMAEVHVSELFVVLQTFEFVMHLKINK